MRGDLYLDISACNTLPNLLENMITKFMVIDFNHQRTHCHEPRLQKPPVVLLRTLVSPRSIC